MFIHIASQTYCINTYIVTYRGKWSRARELPLQYRNKDLCWRPPDFMSYQFALMLPRSPVPKSPHQKGRYRKLALSIFDYFTLGHISFTPQKPVTRPLAMQWPPYLVPSRGMNARPHHRLPGWSQQIPIFFRPGLSIKALCNILIEVINRECMVQETQKTLTYISLAAKVSEKAASMLYISLKQIRRPAQSGRNLAVITPPQNTQGILEDQMSQSQTCSCTFNIVYMNTEENSLAAAEGQN